MRLLVKLAHCVAIGLMLQVLPAMAEQTSTRLTSEQKVGEERSRSGMVISDSFVAGLSQNNELSWLYEANTRDLWLLDHERQLALRVNQAEVHQFADKLAGEVAKFEASIANLPEAQRELSMLRFRQLFERANETLASRVDAFVEQSEQDEFASIQCQWHNMIESHGAGDKVLGRACLARADAFPHGTVLASFLSELAGFSDIVERADTGPISVPVLANPMTLAAHRSMVAIKVIPNSEFDSAAAGLEVVSLSQETHSTSEYQVPEHYQRQGFSQASLF